MRRRSTPSFAAASSNEMSSSWPAPYRCRKFSQSKPRLCYRGARMGCVGLFGQFGRFACERRAARRRVRAGGFECILKASFWETRVGSRWRVRSIRGKSWRGAGVLARGGRGVRAGKRGDGGGRARRTSCPCDCRSRRPFRRRRPASRPSTPAPPRGASDGDRARTSPPRCPASRAPGARPVAQTGRERGQADSRRG